MEEAGLADQVIEELTSPKATGEPVIIIERSRPTSIHLFAIWSRFEGVDQYIRSRILLDAYRQVKGEAEALKVTVSMGLSPDEAAKMGVG